MIMNGINTNACITCKAAILASPEIQGDFDISVRNFLEFISIPPYLQKNFTAKLAFMIRRSGGRGGGIGSDLGYGIPNESYV